MLREEDRQHKAARRCIALGAERGAAALHLGPLRSGARPDTAWDAAIVGDDGDFYPPLRF